MNFPQNSIFAKQLINLIGSPDCPAIIDVRGRKAFDESKLMIATAEWRDGDRAAEWAADMGDGNVIVYCVHGHEVSQGAAQALQSSGVRAVFLEGGIEGFIEAGGETVAK